MQMARKKVEERKPGRPAKGRTQPDQFQMRANPEFYRDLDAWRRLWPDSPSRAEVIRRLVRGERPPGRSVP